MNRSENEMTAKQILPPETSEAIRRMIEITQKIKALAEREADAIETQDAEALGAIIAQKSDLSLTYGKGRQGISCAAGGVSGLGG